MLHLMWVMYKFIFRYIHMNDLADKPGHPSD